MNNTTDETWFGTSEHYKTVGVNGHLVKLDVDGAKVVDFACSRDGTCIIQEGEKANMPSIIPDKPDATGLIHFYKSGDEWKFLTEEEYEAKKGELPALSFACRNVIEEFKEKCVGLYSLDPRNMRSNDLYEMINKQVS